MKFKIIPALVGLLCLATTKSSAQIPSFQNTEKYWWYRYRLVNDFMKIGDQCGESIPAEKRFKKHPFGYDPNYYFRDSTKFQPTLHWGDATEHLGNYIMMLATEYRMLADNGLSTNRTVKELYYALGAFDRLDRTAEDYFMGIDANYPCNTHGSFNETHHQDPENGFFIRDDVPIYNNPSQGYYDFVRANYDHFNRPGAGFKVQSVSDGAFKERVMVNGQLQPYHTTWNGKPGQKRLPQEGSHDQMVELYMGTGLVTRMVDDWVTYNGNGIARQAGNAQYRMAKYGCFSYDGLGTFPKWRLKNPLTHECPYGTDPLASCDEGGANILVFGIGAADGLRASAKFPGSCTDNDIRAMLNWTGPAYGAAWQLVQYATVPQRLGKDVNDLVYPSTYSCFSDSWRAPDICYTDVWSPFGTVHLPTPCIKNTTFRTIKKFCISYDNMRYPHVPLVYKLISGPGSGHGADDINLLPIRNPVTNQVSQRTDKWAALFEKAPSCGCYNYYNDGDPYDYGDWYWSSPNWSQDYFKRGNKEDYQADYNNLDYMYMYNLYNMNETGYIKQYFNPYYKERFSVDYPYYNGILGSNTNKIALNFLEYLSLVNTHKENANLTYRGAKAVDLLPGFKADRGSSVKVYVQDFSCDKDKNDHYFYASINGAEVTDVSGSRTLGKGTEVQDYDTAGALDLVPYTVIQRDNPDYDPSSVDTSTTESTDPEYLAALQNYKDSLWKVVYDGGDSDLVAQLNALGVYSTASKMAPTVSTVNPTIYPNPTTGEFTISVPEGGWYDVHIYNAFGVEVATDKLEGRQARKISLSSHFPSGTYTVVLLSDGKDRIVRKLVLMR